VKYIEFVLLKKQQISAFFVLCYSHNFKLNKCCNN